MTLPALKDTGPELELTRPLRDGHEQVLTPDALAFVARLAERFTPRLEQLLALRDERQKAYDGGALPGFREDTRAIREANWRVATIPEEVLDRRTEITGPVSRKMVINALNSGAQVYMADFEDSTAPAWDTLVHGQRNLRDAVRGTIEFTNDRGKVYRLDERTAVLMVRPRGLHLPEVHVRLAGRPIPGALLDFGLYLYHNHAALTARGSRPYFYLAKLEHHDEAQWWNAVIDHAEQELGLAPGTVRVTVLIETLQAVFQMHEIMHALRGRVLGLNCGRWDYIFSTIKTLRAHPDRVLPERGQLAMTTPFLRAYSRLLIRTCHKRGAFAMGGMAAQIPVRGDRAANQQALERVRADKAREAGDGHDGTWVAHPALEPLARAEFNRVLDGPNQLDAQPFDGDISAADLLASPAGTITEGGLRGNIRVALQYLAAWLAGNGCVPIDHLMEDAATAEIARAQLWQWRRHRASLDDGRVVSDGLLRTCLDEEMLALSGTTQPGQRERLVRAAALLDDLVFAAELSPFLTLPAYRILVQEPTGGSPR